jgi:predicted deacylase
MTEIVEPCQCGIDFHSGSDQRINLPQVRCDGDNPETLAMARAFGAPVILQAKRRAGSLREAARSLGKPVIVYEAGETDRFDEEAIQAGHRGTLRVLRHLGILRRPRPSRKRHSLFCRKTHWARATQSGLCHLRVRLGSHLARDQNVAVITDTYGGDHSIVRTKLAGVVIGITSKPLVNRGDAIVHVARPEPEVTPP